MNDQPPRADVSRPVPVAESAADTAPLSPESAPFHAPPPAPAVSTESQWIGPRAAIAALALATLGVLIGGALWQKVANMQEQLARQAAQAQADATEARALAKQATTLVQDAVARLSVQEARLSEVALQRSQLDELMQSLSRSRDENLLVDLESALRLATQQAQLTGSVEPMLAALKTAEQRIARAAQPRLGLLVRAVARDADRIRAAAVSDLPSLLVRLDELARLMDEVPLANAVGAARPAARAASAPSAWPSWVPPVLAQTLAQAGSLVRVSRIDAPESALLAPDQAYFLREHLKLRVLNARLALLSRQPEAARTDLAQLQTLLRRYADAGSRPTQVSLQALQQIQQQARTLQVPRMDETLALLTTLAAGR